MFDKAVTYPYNIKLKIKNYSITKKTGPRKILRQALSQL